MPSIWSSFLPYSLARELALHPEMDLLGFEQRGPAVVLFGDISGFTAISEALGRSGRRGTEELTALLNGYFEPMIDLIRSYGGMIGKFTGDAMTVVFPYDNPDDQPLAAGQALHCALEMQRKMGAYAALETSAGTYSLAMKAGLAAGSVYTTVVGDPDLRLEYILAGTPLDRSAEAEHQASAGEVVAEDALLESIGGVDKDAVGRGFSRVRKFSFASLQGSPLPVVELPPREEEAIEAFLHPSIAQRVRTGQISFINEHRRVTVLFIGFSGFDYDHDPEVGQGLQDYFSRVVKIIHRYDGYLNKVDMGDKGSKYLVCFGTPITHENDMERALRCALDLRALPGTKVRIGVNSGFVFAGQVGSPVRQEYTVMGDAVNLAARLMQAAGDGQILVNAAAGFDPEGKFDWGSPQELQVKGKSERVRVQALAGLKAFSAVGFREPQYALPMVGREAELARVSARLDQVVAGQGQIVGLTAEAGMGKSRLAAEIIKRAADRGFRVYGGACLSHGTNTSYLVWHDLLRSIWDLDPDWPLEKQQAHLQAQLARDDPSSVDRAPLLGPPLNLPIPENELIRSLDAKMRKASLEALIVETIRHRAEKSPLLLVFEDCHWIDPLSSDLLEAVGRNISGVPVLLLVVYRPPETGQAQLPITRFGHFLEVRLSEFTPQDAEHLIRIKLTHLEGARKQIPAELVALITQRAQGNPFFIDEMINWLHDQSIDLTAPQALQSFHLPDSLRSLIISRIDRLPEETKSTLKVASVIGRLFKADWLWGVSPELGTPERVKEQLTQLCQLDITPLDKPEPELEYLFKHILTREVAYESLPLSMRTRLHHEIGRYIEQQYQDADRYLDLLAYHYEMSDDVEKKCEYCLKAGKAAQQVYANDTSIDYYQKVLPLLPEKERIPVMLEIGTIWGLTGRWTDAEEIYQQALGMAERSGDPFVQARCQREIGVISHRKGVYQAALSWLECARLSFEELGAKDEVARTLSELGVVYWYLGDYTKALAHYRQCQQIAEDLQDKKIIYRTLGNMGVLYKIQGDYSRALRCYGQAQQIAAEMGDRLRVGILAGNRGNIFLDQGDYAQALRSYVENLQIAQETGDRQGVSISIGNMGYIYSDLGDYKRALACFHENLKIALELGDRLGVGLALGDLATIYSARRQYQMAEKLLRYAIAIGRELDTPYELCGYLYTIADVLAHQESYAEALSFAQEANRVAGEVDRRTIQFKAQALAIRLRTLQGEIQTDEMITAFEELAEKWQDDWEDEEEAAEVYYEIWRLVPSRQPYRQKVARLYRNLYTRTSNVQYKQRYEEITGEQLPEPPQLPPLPEAVSQAPVSQAALMEQVEGMLVEIRGEMR